MHECFTIIKLRWCDSFLLLLLFRHQSWGWSFNKYLPGQFLSLILCTSDRFFFYYYDRLNREKNHSANTHIHLAFKNASQCLVFLVLPHILSILFQRFIFTHFCQMILTILAMEMKCTQNAFIHKCIRCFSFFLFHFLSVLLGLCKCIIYIHI